MTPPYLDEENSNMFLNNIFFVITINLSWSRLILWHLFFQMKKVVMIQSNISFT